MFNTRDIEAALVIEPLQGLDPLNRSSEPPVEVTYSFHDFGFGFDWPYADEVKSWAEWLPEERTVIRAAFEDLEAVLNVDFKQVEGTGDIPLGLVHEYTDPNIAGIASWSLEWWDNTVIRFETVGTMAWWAPTEIWYHEIGHTLGLKHPFEGADTLPEEYDNYGYSIMSYDPVYDPAATIFDSTPGAGSWRRFDVMALESLWGGSDGEHRFGIDNFGSDAGGWSSQWKFPRQVGDIDGDGAADIVGFGLHRTFSSLAGEDGAFADIQPDLGNFCADTGWTSNNLYPRLLADFDGDGMQDILGFGAAASFGARSLGGGVHGAFEKAITDFAQQQGWRSDAMFPRRAGDLDGDGREDIVGFGAERTFTASSAGDGTFGALTAGIADFSQLQGWADTDRFPRLVGDIDGDGHADIVGFGIARTYVALGNGDGTFAPVQTGIVDFSQAQGWASNDATPRLLADINGDGRDDIVGFGANSTYTAMGQADGSFGGLGVLSPDFAIGDGWTGMDAMPRAAADVNGDGFDDLIGFSDQGVLVTLTAPPDGAAATSAFLEAAPRQDAGLLTVPGAPDPDLPGFDDRPHQSAQDSMILSGDWFDFA